MPYELFLALRYLRSRRRAGAGARATALAGVAGVACGVAALVVATALANGFRDEMRDKILGGTAHVTVTRADGSPVRDWRSTVARLRSVEGVTGAEPTSYAGALLEGPEAAAYAVVRGVDQSSAREIESVRRTLTSGPIESLFAPATVGDAGRAEDGPALPVIIGAELAARTGLRAVGDEGWLVTGEKFFEPSGFVPRARRVRVAGVFRSGLYEYDSTWAYASLAAAADLTGAEAGSAAALSVRTADIYRSAETATRVRAAMGADFTVVDWQEANRPLFAALALERRTVSLIIALVLFVAALNITTTLVLVVVERRPDIAILRAMGAPARGVMLVFVAEGAIVGAFGALAGVALGLLACYLGDRFRLVSLPADVYSLSSIPFRPRASEVALAALLAFAVCLLATLYPARAAARLRPAEALRYE